MTSRLDSPAHAALAANDTGSRWKVVVAHNGALTTCDGLLEAVKEAMEDVQIIDAPSAEAARSIMRGTSVDVCFVCLDLAPSPIGGIKLAQELVRAGVPLILITRSLRWLPASAAELRVVPWVPPEASASEIVRAVDEAISELDSSNQVTLDSSEDEEESIPQRISEV